MRFLAAIIAIIVTAVLPACAQSNKDIIQLRQDAFTSAFAEGNESKLSSIFSENVSIAPPGAGIISGKSNVIKFWMDMREGPVHSAKTKTLEVDALSDDLILEIGQYEVFDVDGNSLGTGTSVLTWRKVNDEWLMELDHWN